MGYNPTVIPLARLAPPGCAGRAAAGRHTRSPRTTSPQSSTSSGAATRAERPLSAMLVRFRFQESRSRSLSSKGLEPAGAGMIGSFTRWRAPGPRGTTGAANPRRNTSSATSRSLRPSRTARNFISRTNLFLCRKLCRKLRRTLGQLNGNMLTLPQLNVYQKALATAEGIELLNRILAMLNGC
jgi:hypothetical protein